jgi:cell fate regulator YaaT (PSP1 superfamily)
LHNVVGVRFKKVGKIYYFDPVDLPVTKDQYVIVETARGIEYGKVAVGKKQVGESDVVLPLKKVQRIANDADAKMIEENIRAARQAFTTCLEKIRNHQLKMKLIDVEYTFGRNKIIFFLLLRAGLTSGSWLRIWLQCSVLGLSFARSAFVTRRRC